MVPRPRLFRLAPGTSRAVGTLRLATRSRSASKLVHLVPAQPQTPSPAGRCSIFKQAFRAGQALRAQSARTQSWWGPGVGSLGPGRPLALPSVFPVLLSSPPPLPWPLHSLGCLAGSGRWLPGRRERTPKGLEYASERGFQGRRKHDTVAHTDHGVRESSTVY